MFTSSSDPVKLGLVDSFNRPGGNLTGVHLFTSLLGTKRLELMRQLLPANTLIVVLVNPKNPNADVAATELQDAARTLGQSISLVRASTETEIDAAFATLISYGVSLADGYRQVGTYAGRILKGEKPANLPVVQPTKFEMAINLKTAKALGLTIPTSLLVRADEVIE